MTALEVYKKSDGELTKRFYAHLEERGVIGQVAMNLFRAQKCSAQAKEYTRRYKGAAYDRKQWSIDNLVKILGQHAAALDIEFGWKQDASTLFDGEPSWVLYVDLPKFGQVSFHSPTRGSGPDYQKEFDGCKGMSAGRIIQFADAVANGENCSDLAATPWRMDFASSARRERMR